MTPKLKVYCLNWHLRYSPAFQFLCIEPLKPYMELLPTGWDGDNVLQPAEVLQDASTPVVFFQLPPPPDILAIPNARLIWIPMWDHAYGYSQEWWDSLPKYLRIVAFSKNILKRARAAEIPALSLQFYVNPHDFNPAPWNERRILFYWNRAGLVGPEFLRRFCAALHVDICQFRDQIDPSINGNAAYQLPTRLGNTEIRCYTQTHFQTREDYLRILSQANVFIAPRSKEGVGLSLLEAMAQGCAVFSYDAPAMNEYIDHLENGYLLPPFHPSGFTRIIVRLQHLVWRLQTKRIFKHKHFEHPVTQFQNWQEISAIDLEGLGKAARQRHFEGNVEWQKSIPEYAHFILDW